MEKEKRSTLERLLWTLGAGGVNAGLVGALSHPRISKPHRARLAAGAGVSGLTSQAGAEIGGALGGDSYGSRAAGGALGGAVGGAASTLFNPQSSQLYKYLIRAGLTPKKATGFLLGAGGLGGIASGAIGGMLSRPSGED